MATSTHHHPSSAKLSVVLLALALATLVPLTFGGTRRNAAAAAPNSVDVIINLYDANHDGQLDKGELQRMHDLDPDKFAEAMKWDTNKNGALDRDEINAWRDFSQKLAEAARIKAAAAAAARVKEAAATAAARATAGGGS